MFENLTAWDFALWYLLPGMGIAALAVAAARPSSKTMAQSSALAIVFGVVAAVIFWPLILTSLRHRQDNQNKQPKQ